MTEKRVTEREGPTRPPSGEGDEGGDGERVGSDRIPPGESEETVGRKTDRNPFVHWLLVSGDRLWMVGALSVVASVTYFGLGLAGVIGVASGSLIASTFTSAITGVFTIVAVTISINQLVLSRMIGSPARIKDRMDSVHDFRTGVEQMDEDTSVSPTMPAEFLENLLEILRDRAGEMARTYGSDHDPEKRAEVRELATTLQNICDQVETELPNRDLSLFRVLSPILTNSFSEYFNTARHLRENSKDMTREERRAVDDVIEALEEVNRTRHYFKTLYIHEELATVSRLILLTGLPAVLVSQVIILLYSADTIFLGESLLLVVVSLAFGLVLLPLNVLFAYGLRMGTIAKMTTTFGTFTPVEEMP